MTSADEMACSEAELVQRAKQAFPSDALAAAEICRRLRDRFPLNPVGYRVGLAAARALQQFDDAQAILSGAERRFGAQPWVTANRAFLAHANGETDAAIRLAHELRERHPDDPSGYSVGVGMLLGLNRLYEAEALLKEAQPRFASAPWFLRQSAKVAGLVANRADATRLIASLRETDLWRDFGQGLHGRPGEVAVVVGMHRAGTSLCAKLVGRLGFDLGGPLLAPNVRNPDGVHEHKEIAESHEALLSHLGVTWDTAWTVRRGGKAKLGTPEALAILARLKAIVVDELKRSGGRWAFKDPRTACFLPAWIDLFDSLGVAPIWILAVREPHAVAASLYARNQLPLEIGELLWVEHYLDTLRHLGPRIACVVHYERWFSSGDKQMRTLASHLGASSEAAIEQAAQSVIGDLRHHVPKPTDAVLGVARDLHAWLLADPLDLTTLQKRAAAAWHALEAGRPATAARAYQP